MDTSFLGDDITDDDRDQRLKASGGRRSPQTVPQLSLERSSVAFGEDAMILGDGGGAYEDMHTADVGVRKEVTQARFYVGGSAAALLDDDAVPEVVPGVVPSELRLTPFEEHILSFINGKRSTGRLKKKSGLDASDFRASLAMLADKSVIRLRTTKRKRKSKDGSDRKSILSDRRSAEGAAVDSERTVVADAESLRAFRSQLSASGAVPAPVEGAHPAPSTQLRGRRADGRLLSDPSPDAPTLGPGALGPGARVGPSPKPAAPVPASEPLGLPPTAPIDRSLHGLAGFRSVRVKEDLDLASRSHSGLRGHRNADDDDAPPDARNASGIFARARPSSEGAAVDPPAAPARGPVSAFGDPLAAGGRPQPVDSFDPVSLGTGDYLEPDAAPRQRPTTQPRASAVAARARTSGSAPRARPRTDEASARDSDLAAHTLNLNDIPSALRDPTGLASLPDGLRQRARSEVPADDGYIEVSSTSGVAIEEVDDAPVGTARRGTQMPPTLPAQSDDALRDDLDAPDDGDTAQAPRLPSAPERPAAHGAHHNVVLDDGVMGLPGQSIRPAAVAGARAAATAAAQVTAERRAPPPIDSMQGPASLGSGGERRKVGADPQTTTRSSLPGRAGLFGQQRPSAMSTAPFEQGRKAEKIFEQALKDQHEGRTSSARMNAKLAATYDPSVQLYRDFLAQLEAMPMAVPPTAGPGKPREVLLFEQAAEAESRGEYERAVTLLTQAIAINENAPALRNRLGVVLAIRLKRHEEALVHLKRAVDLEPGNLIYMNNFSKVTAMLESAIDKIPHDPRAHAQGTRREAVAIRKVRPKLF